MVKCSTAYTFFLPSKNNLNEMSQKLDIKYRYSLICVYTVSPHNYYFINC